MSSAATRPAGPTARASSSVVAPQPHPMSSTHFADAPASQDAERDFGPDGFLDYDPDPYEKKLRADYAAAGWHIRDDAFEQVERFLNSGYASVDLANDLAPVKDSSFVKD